jgi:hypothetical protein
MSSLVTLVRSYPHLHRVPPIFTACHPLACGFYITVPATRELSAFLSQPSAPVDHSLGPALVIICQLACLHAFFYLGPSGPLRLLSTAFRMIARTRRHVHHMIPLVSNSSSDTIILCVSYAITSCEFAFPLQVNFRSSTSPTLAASLDSKNTSPLALRPKGADVVKALSLAQPTL